MLAFAMGIALSAFGADSHATNAAIVGATTAGTAVVGATALGATGLGVAVLGCRLSNAPECYWGVVLPVAGAGAGFLFGAPTGAALGSGFAQVRTGPVLAGLGIAAGGALGTFVASAATESRALRIASAVMAGVGMPLGAAIGAGFAPTRTQRERKGPRAFGVAPLLGDDERGVLVAMQF